MNLDYALTITVVSAISFGVPMFIAMRIWYKRLVADTDHMIAYHAATLADMDAFNLKHSSK